MSTACFEQGVSHTYQEEFGLVGAVLHGLAGGVVQLIWLAAQLAWLTALLGLAFLVLWANFGQRIDWHRLMVMTDSTGRLG